MTNTKFRKRALLSSVAMLLVALVALGSATFAWFVDDPNADAKGLNASSQSSTGLQIKTDSSTSWSHHAKIACASSATGGAAITGIYLSPAMANIKTATAPTFHSVKAAAANASAPLTTDKWAEVNTLDHMAGNGVYNETINLRVTGTTQASQDIKLTGIDLGLAGNMQDAVVVVLRNGSTYYTFSKASRSVPYWNATITNGTTVYSASSANWTTVKAAASGMSTSVATIAAGTNQEATLELYVYLDGTHSSVYSDNATSAASIITKCDLYFTNATQGS